MVSGSDTNFVVSVVPGNAAAPVKRVLVLYTPESSPGTWTALDLALSNGNTWSGAAPNPGGVAVQYFVEAVDAAGNVASSNNNGSDFGSSTAAGSTSAALSISLAGTQPTTGYFQGAVTATVGLGAGATAPLSYTLDGGPSTPLPPADELIVTGDGEHSLTVTDAAGNSATSSFDIDTLGPSFSSATSPDLSANGWVPGVFNGSAGSFLQVEVTDPGAAVASLTYTESGAQSTSGTLSGTGLRLPIELPLTANGVTTVTLSATDQSGLKSPPTSVTVDVDAAAPAVQCTVPPGLFQGASGTGGSGSTSHNVSVTCQVTDNESGIAPNPAIYSSYSSAAASFTLATTVPAGQSSSTAMTSSATICSVLGDCTTVGPFGPFEVNLSPPATPPAVVAPPPVVVVTPSTPAVGIIGPASGADYVLGQKVSARYTCADSSVAITRCTGSVANGGYVKTSSVGRYSFTVTAINSAGRSATSSVSYVISYRICEATPPAQNSSTVTFKIYPCNVTGADVTARSTTVTAVTVDRTKPPATTRPAGSKKFAFEIAGKGALDTFQLDTKGLSPGLHTLQVRILNDPVVHSITFSVKRPAPPRPPRR